MKHWPMMIAAAVLAFSLLAILHACDRQPETAGLQVPPPTPMPTFDFFDGTGPVPPWEWADVPRPERSDPVADLLASLHLRQVKEKHARGIDLRDVEQKYAQGFDPTPHFFEDLEVLHALGSQATIRLSWIDDFYIALPGGKRIMATDISGYFFAMAAVLRETGGLQGLENDVALSATLLSIGHNFYHSDSDSRTARNRIFMWDAAWSVAFKLRELRARNLGDEAEAELWKKRGEDRQLVTNLLLGIRPPPAVAADPPIAVLQLQSAPGSDVNGSFPVEVAADFNGHLLLEGDIGQLRGTPPDAVNFDMAIMSGQTPVQTFNFTLDRVWQARESLPGTRRWRVALTDAPLKLEAGQQYQLTAQVLILGSATDDESAAAHPLAFRLFLQPLSE